MTLSFTIAKRSQITAFLIIGFFVLAIFIVVILFWHKQGEVVVPSTVNTAEFRTYVEKCLDTAATESLQLIGSQGGLLFEDQGGNDTMDGTFFNGSKNVGYGLRGSLNELAAPDYPAVLPAYGGYKYTLAQLHTTFSGYNFWGRNTLVFLCDRFGTENNPLAASVQWSCDPEFYGRDANTIQNKIETSVLLKTRACVAGYSGASDSDVVIANSSVLFGLDDVRFSVYVSGSVKTQGTASAIGFVSVTNNARFKRMYALLSAAISENVYNESFKFSLYPSLPECVRGCTGLELQTERSSQADVYFIKIIDTKAKPSPLTFVVVAQNRRPVLEYVSEHSNSQADIVVAAGSRVVIRPKVYDSDGDSLTVTYSGWKSPDVWEKSPEYLNGCDGVKQLCAGASLTSDDVGLHTLDVRVTDSAGLYDYQSVKVLVTE